MRSLFVTICALAINLSIAWCDEGHHHELTEQEVGSVHFVTSCSKDVQVEFQRAVALLHSFQYEQSREAFNEILKHDPQCAMAEWGVAMSHYHGLWGNGDAAAGRAAIRQAQAISAANKNITAKERGYIDAVAEIYAEDGKDNYAHGQAYETKMAAVQTANPEDSEARKALSQLRG